MYSPSSRGIKIEAAGVMDLNPHVQAPQHVKDAHRQLQKARIAAHDTDTGIFDHAIGIYAGFVLSDQARVDLRYNHQSRTAALDSFLGSDGSCTSPMEAYEHRDAPGLYVFPQLIPPRGQVKLLASIFHRDLSNPSHKTNLHLHYNIPYPPLQNHESVSYFDSSSQHLTFEPKDPTIHNPISTSLVLTRKLRWLTLGGQYDWTDKTYPSTPPPLFPPDVAALIHTLFPSILPQAAIVNLYSPGDTLNPHRDVAEACAQPLVSLSLGCDGLFLVAAQNRTASIRLRSGDVVVMSGSARTAWHSVPAVLRDTCPDHLRDWPAGLTTEYEHWRGWMSGKRVNLNVRQMHR